MGGMGVTVKVGKGVRVGGGAAIPATGVLVAQARPVTISRHGAISHCFDCKDNLRWMGIMKNCLKLETYPLHVLGFIQFNCSIDLLFSHPGRFPANRFGSLAFKVLINLKKVGDFF